MNQPQEARGSELWRCQDGAAKTAPSTGEQDDERASVLHGDIERAVELEPLDDQCVALRQQASTHVSKHVSKHARKQGREQARE